MLKRPWWDKDKWHEDPDVWAAITVACMPLCFLLALLVVLEMR